MALRIAEAIAGLAVAATVVLSAVTPMAAATTTTAAPAPAQAAAPAQAQARATPQRQRRSPPASAAARSRNPVLAWGRWDQERSQDPVAPRIEGVANSNALVLGSESGQAAAAVDGSQEQPLDRSWTHAAFRAFHEMRAGSPPAASAGNGIDQESQGEKAGRGGGKDPLVGFRRLASRKQRRETNANDSATVAREEDEEEGEQRGKTRPPPPAACWHMRGRLTNTATGQTIALVEGVELARSLAFETAPSRKAAAADKRQKKLRNSKVAVGDNTRLPAAAATAPVGGEGELEVDKALKPGLWTAFGALACSKFFMYQDPSTGEPMDHFRNTPVEKKQAVRTYERFSQVVSHLLQPNGRVLVVSEWGGRSVKAETANNNGVEEVEGGGGFFSGGGGSRLSDGKDGRPLVPAHAPRRVFNLHFFVEARTPKEERELKRWQERPGAKWISFGTPPPRAHGCKEVYSYITGREGGGGGGGGGGEGGKAGGKEVSRGAGGGGGIKLMLPWFSNRKSGMPDGGMTASGNGGKALLSASSSPSRGGGAGRGSGGLMSYTRYGECPTWYGTGRMCGLDVQARRVDSFASLPAKLRQKVLEVDPEFEAGPPGTMEEVRRAAREKRLEREEKRRRKGRSLRGLFGS